MHHNFYSTLSLANKARRVVRGSFVLDGVRSKNVFLVMISDQASDNTQKNTISKCQFHNVDYLILEDTLLNQAVGEYNIKVVGISDNGFAKKLKEYAKG